MDKETPTMDKKTRESLIEVHFIETHFDSISQGLRQA
jgi:hypothetical protein